MKALNLVTPQNPHLQKIDEDFLERIFERKIKFNVYRQMQEVNKKLAFTCLWRPQV